MTRAAPPEILPAETNPRIARFFRYWTERMLRSSFAGVRLSNESDDARERVRADDAPLIVAMNHQSWWDPLLGIALADLLCPDRPGIAPMDLEMLRRFGIFRRVGVFGIDPDDPRSAVLMRDYAKGFFDEHPRGALWLTPQGEFADPRAPIRLRPGAATVASAVAGVTVVSIAVEYAFWLDKKPEVLMHASVVEAPERPSVPGWHRALTRAMQRDRDRLAELVIARNPDAFDALIDPSAGGTSPIYNLWLRLSGKRTDLASERTARPNQTAGRGADR